MLRSPDYKTALPEVLQILGEAAKSDRCSLVQNVPDPVTGEAAVKIFAEWCQEGIGTSVEYTPELETALLWSDFPQFQEKLTQGEVYSFSIDELDEPAKSILQAQWNVSMTLVPIMVRGEFWGVFSFDYCRETRIFAETDVVENGYQDCDRVAVMQHFEDDTGKTLGSLYQLYEWDSSNTCCQLYHPQYKKISSDRLEKYYAKLQAGECISGLIEEFDEPFRSEQIKLGVKSTHAVPIFINDAYWGVIGIDFCREARRLTLPETAVFKTAASCVGSAIYRQQIQQQREEAEKTIILEREQAAVEKAAELTKVNAVLSRSLGKITDTADLDEFLGQVVLATLIPKVAQHLTTDTGVEVEIAISGEAYPIKPSLGMNLLRIVQEAIANTLKHANANKIEINLTYEPQQLSLQIRDDGNGFDTSQQSLGFGLMGMQQRVKNLGGQLTVSSILGEGTKIDLVVEVGSESKTGKQKIQIMKVQYFEDTDTLYIEFQADNIAESKELDENTVLDVDDDGNVCAITLEHASQRTDIERLTVEGIAA